MRKSMAVAFVVFGLASSAWGQSTTDTHCTSYSSNSIDCSSNTTPTGPSPAEEAARIERQKEQQREMNENASKMGAALGGIIYQKRMQHAQEKSDLTAVVFCRQNPSGTWTFQNKPPMACGVLEMNVVAYCTVNAKKPLCKDVAKLGPAPSPVVAAATPRQKPQPTEQAVERSVAMAQTQPETQAQQAPVLAQPVHSLVVLQPQTANVAAPTPEVSVAEAARQARIAKAVREAKEKAERDNPPPQQQ